MNRYAASNLTGADSLAAIDHLDTDGEGTPLADGDDAIVIVSGGLLYSYTYDAAGTAAESLPSVIQPVSNTGAGRWIQVLAAGDSQTTIHDFSYGDATPALILEVPANKRVYSVAVHIFAAFNGTSPALTVGTTADPDLLVEATQNLPSVVGVYELYPDIVLGDATEIYLSMTPGSGASTGAGQVIITTET